MEHHLTLEKGNYFLLGISPSVHFLLEYPMENIQIHSVLVLNLLLELSDQLHSICYPHRICRLQTAVLQSHRWYQLCLIWTRSLSDFFVVFLQRILSLPYPPHESTCTWNSCWNSCNDSTGHFYQYLILLRQTICPTTCHLDPFRVLCSLPFETEIIFKNISKLFISEVYSYFTLYCTNISHIHVGVKLVNYPHLYFSHFTHFTLYLRTCEK